ncbi:MAG: DUF5719 family protein [Acidimicrobiales bacterium]|nr:DUF5719 family protein [Acidimicrobiales bacterium]
MNRRLPIVVVLLGAVVLALLVDRGVDDEPVAADDTVPGRTVFPIAAPRGALSSTWFCAGGTGDEEAFADHDVVIANPTDTAAEATVTVFGGVVEAPAVEVDPEDLDEEAGSGESGSGEGDGGEEAEGSDEAENPEPVTQIVEVGAQSRQRLALSEVVAAPIVSALVESDVGGVIVEHEVSSVNGHDAKPCATTASPTWHFAWGNTTAEARELLVLFNPFPQDAIVDGVFSTEDGVREPARFDGLVVPARGTVGIDLGDDVTRRQEVAGTLTTRAGRIVVDRVLRIDSGRSRGLTVQLGAPEPQQDWVFPDGYTSEQVREEYVVYNPGGEVAEVAIEFRVDDPETNGIPEPIDLSLPPGTHQVVDIGEDGRVPAEVSHTAIVRSANDVPIVAERVVYSDRENRRGITVTGGSPVEAPTWSFAAGSATETTDEVLVLVNLDDEVLAEVDVATLAGGQRLPVADLQGIELGPGERRVISLDESTNDSESLPLVVSSSEPIVVERGLYQRGDDQRGMSNAVGIPSPEGLRAPADPLEAGGEDTDVGGEGDGTGGDADGGGDDGGVPEAPDDVDLPEPDETIVIEDPDAEAEDPSSSPTTSGSDGPTDEDVPDTEP